MLGNDAQLSLFLHLKWKRALKHKLPHKCESGQLGLEVGKAKHLCLSLYPNETNEQHLTIRQPHRILTHLWGFLSPQWKRGKNKLAVERRIDLSAHVAYPIFKATIRNSLLLGSQIPSGLFKNLSQTHTDTHCLNYSHHHCIRAVYSKRQSCHDNGISRDGSPERNCIPRQLLAQQESELNQMSEGILSLCPAQEGPNLHRRGVGNRWCLRSLPTQAILRFYYSMYCLPSSPISPSL